MMSVTTAYPAPVRDLVRSFAPVVSVYLGAQPPTGDPVPDVVNRRDALIQALRRLGADEASVAAVAAHLATVSAGPTRLAIFAAGGRILHTQPIPDLAVHDEAYVGAPAHVLPVLAAFQRRPAHVQVIVNRAGAEVTTVPAGAETGWRTVVRGPDDATDRPEPRGRYEPGPCQAWDSWAPNAAAVAGFVVGELIRVRARILLTAGDAYAVRLLRDHLPSAVLRELEVRHLPGGRSADRTGEARREALAGAVEGFAAAEAESVLMRVLAAGAERGTTVEGSGATLAALADGRLSTLVLGDEVSPLPAWYGPARLAVDTPDQAPPGTRDGLRPGRLTDVAVRAALMTDARVVVVPSPVAAKLTDGVGGLCRYR